MKLKYCYTQGLRLNGWRGECCDLGGLVPGIGRFPGQDLVGRSTEDRSWMGSRFLRLLAPRVLWCLQTLELGPHQL